MKPTELLERLSMLVSASRPNQTVLVAPINMAQARDVIDLINSDDEMSLCPCEGQVTSTDLKDFLTWINK